MLPNLYDSQYNPLNVYDFYGNSYIKAKKANIDKETNELTKLKQTMATCVQKEEGKMLTLS